SAVLVYHYTLRTSSGAPAADECENARSVANLANQRTARPFATAHFPTCGTAADHPARSTVGHPQLQELVLGLGRKPLRTSGEQAAGLLHGDGEEVAVHSPDIAHARIVIQGLVGRDQVIASGRVS